MRPGPFGLLFAHRDARRSAAVAGLEPAAARVVGRARPRPLIFLAALLFLAAHLGSATRAAALCNIIPPAERSFPSTQGSVTSPIVAPGDEVTLSLNGCDAGPGFNSNPAANVITVTFLPAGDPQAVVNVTSGVTVPAADCAAGSGPCLTLSFTMPSTVSATFPDGLAGPAEIRVTNGTIAALIGPLSQPRPDTTCDKMAETVFRQFTVLPPPNVFRTLVDDPATRVLAALDGSGSLLIPFDYRTVLPLGPAEPVAALLSGSTTIDAFASSPGTPIAVPDSSWVRSFTINGRPVPPLLRATEAGNQVFGASDGAQGIVRIARSLNGAPAIFDLQYLRSSNGRGPVVIPGGRYSVPPPGPALPLANLRSTATAAAFTRDEGLEGNLNGLPFSSDSDENDAVVEIIDAPTFTTTLTGMAASPTNNPIVGGAAVEAGGDLVALLESEAQQGSSDLNGNGQPGTDDVLRVLTSTGTPLTPTAPAAALLGSPFPGVNRHPLAIDGNLVYFREPNVGFSARSGFIEQGLDVAISRDGRFIATTAPTATGNCGQVLLRRRDGETGGLLPSPPGLRGVCGVTNGANGVVFSPLGNAVYVAAPTVSTVGVFRLAIAPDRITVGGTAGESTAKDGVGGVDGLQGVSRLAITPVTPDGTLFAPRVSLYALAPGENAITAFNVSQNTVLALPPTLAFVKTLLGGVPCTPDATHGCITNFNDPRNLAVSPDGKHVYVAVHGTSRIKGFARTANSAAITEIGDWVDGSNGGSLLGGAIDVALSPDGRFVYALADTDAAITIFSRDATSGLLTFVGTVTNGPGVEGLDQVKRILVSPDGRALVVSNGNGLVVVFDRNTATGGVIFNRQAGAGPSGLATANIAISPDSEHIYLEKDYQASGDVFARESRLRAFDASTGQTKPGLDALNASAKLAAVAAGRAAYLEPANILGAELTLIGLYDAATDTSQPLDSSSFIAHKLALSSQILALAAPESRVGDADGDGNTSEDTLLVVPTANPSATPTIVGVDAIDIGATDICSGGASAGDACVDDADCAGGSCVGVAVATKVRADNFDGTQDVALSVYRFGDPAAIEIGKNVVDFEVSGNLIAFRDSENGLFRVNCNDPNEISFDNDDGDCTDLMMRIYDLKTGTLIDTKQATIKCEQPGCEPGRPYKILGDSVAFLTREADQGNQDLNGDGDANDTVVQVYNVRSGSTDRLTTRPGATILPPLPTTFLGKPIVYREVLESDLGRDLNEDGDQNDVVVLVDGDSDGDGVFDSVDDCVETPDPEQLDSDGDGLGDACDPTPFCGALTPAAPPLAPAAANACQDALGKGEQAILKSYTKAVEACLDQVASGKLSGDATLLCRGSLVTGVPPSDASTVQKIAHAVEQLRRSVEKKCTTVQLVQLGACASTPSAVVQCLTAQAATAAIATTKVAYGAVTAIADTKQLRCQKSIGSQTTTYLTSVGSALRSCLDAVNDGHLVGDAQQLCLGAEAPTGATLPTHVPTRNKLEHAAAKLVKMLAKPCAGTLPAPLDSCGDDATSIGACARCTSWREAVGSIRASYGPP